MLKKLLVLLLPVILLVFPILHTGHAQDNGPELDETDRANLERALTAITTINTLPSLVLTVDEEFTMSEVIGQNGQPYSERTTTETQNLILQIIRRGEAEANLAGTLTYGYDQRLEFASGEEGEQLNMRIIAEGRRVDGNVYLNTITTGLGLRTPENWIPVVDEATAAGLYTDRLDAGLFFNVNGDADDIRQQVDLLREAALDVQVMREVLDENAQIETFRILLDPLVFLGAMESADLLTMIAYSSAEMVLFVVIDEGGVPLEILLVLESTLEGLDLNALAPETYGPGFTLDSLQWSETRTYTVTDAYAPLEPIEAPF